MRVQLTIDGDVQAVLKKRLEDAERVATKTMAVVAKEIQAGFRNQVIGAGLGSRLARTIRAESFPKGGATSLEPAANIWTNAPHIISAFNKGVTIKARDGWWLAFPTKEAGASIRRGRITPAEWERRNGLKLRPIFRPGKPVLLIAELRARSGKRGGFAAPSDSAKRTGRGLATVVIFILVPQTRLTKRLDFDAEVTKGRSRLAALLAQSMARNI